MQFMNFVTAEIKCTNELRFGSYEPVSKSSH